MPDFSDTLHSGTGDVPGAWNRAIFDVCAVLLLAALWPLIHRYKGLSGDAELYAVQALARIHPNLAGDLFLRNASQDSYTFFSPLYAWCIRWVGLRGAAMTLMIALKIWFFAVVCALARELFDRRLAFVSTAFVITIAGSYGGYSVFNYSEDWLTARSLAEPLVITAVLLYFRDFKVGAFLVVVAALFVHPLMALPGLLLLVALWLPLPISAAGALLGLLAALATALYALHQPPDAGAFSVMDAEWLDVVRERSVFLFPHLWRAGDWQSNVLAFLSLAISAAVLSESRVRTLCIAAALVGAAGLGLALVAGTTGPVELFLQGQAWRWVWIARFTAVVLIAPTLLSLWRTEKCGPLCAALVFLGWTFSPVDGAACLAMALLLWVIRRHVTDRAAAYLRWAAFGLAAVALAWAAANSWSLAMSPSPESGLEAPLVIKLRDIFGLGMISISIVWSLLYMLDHTSSRALTAALSAALFAGCLLIYPGAFRVFMREGRPDQIAEFSDWRGHIGPDETVYVLPAHNSATFAWFTLERPSYLTVDQSAGVVFSRATAMEVRRRSDVLSPLMGPDWKLLSGNASAHAAGSARKQAVMVLTRNTLLGICADPKLNFVVARESLGFDPIRHTHTGEWKDWNLYDCRRVHDGDPPA